MSEDYQASQRQRAEALGEEISRFVNRGGNVELLAEAMLNDHPTLQQKQMGLCLAFLRGMAAKTWVDGRNQASHVLAKRIVEAVGVDHYLPFV